MPERFFISDGGILYAPSEWVDRQGYFRYAAHSFILASLIKGGDSRPGYNGQGDTGYAIPLNPPNMEDIFSKLPDVSENHPLWKGIVARAIELELRRRFMVRTERLKLDAGIDESFEYVEREYDRFIFYDEDGKGYGPSWKDTERKHD